MIQQPLHVTPENYAVANGAYFKFTFAGDMMSYCTYKVFDYNTGLPVTTDFHKYSTSTYNGDDVETTLINLPNGKDCIWQVALAQHTQGNTIEPIYDMPVLSGTLSEISGTSLTIEKDISSIYEWWSNGQNHVPCYYEDGRLAYGMIIKIGSESRLITSYNSETGILQIENSFSQTVVSGTRYKIYSNYVISPQYFFKTRTQPTIDLSKSEFIGYMNNAIWCRANYSQAENSLIKYCYFELYWANHSTFNSHIGKVEKIAQSPKIYSQDAVCYFENIYRHDTEHNYNDYYKIVCNVVTQDDYVTSSEYVIERPVSSGNGKCAINCEVQNDSSVYVGGSASVEEYSGRALKSMILRENLDSGEIVCIKGNSQTDCTASTKGNYKYTVLGFESGNNIYGVIGSYVPNAVIEKEVRINLSGYYIMELNHNQTHQGQEYYTVGDVWRFVGDINDTTITQNRDTVLHVGAAQYPVVTNTDTNYMSGTLSAMIGYVNCETKEYVDNITLVNAWRKFITQDKIYLLKSQKGDVWVVNIIDNPETTYQENYYKIPTTFSFSWAECCNVNDIEIRKE